MSAIGANYAPFRHGVEAAGFATPAAAGLDSMSEMGEMESLRLQTLTDWMSKADSANSNILRRAVDAILYNGHAGLGADSKSEVSIESSVGTKYTMLLPVGTAFAPF